MLAAPPAWPSTALCRYDTDWAAAALNRHVKPDGYIACFQNAICDDRIAAVVGSGRTLGVIMTISAGVYDPGVALRTDVNKHAFKVGELDGRKTERAAEVRHVLADNCQQTPIACTVLNSRSSREA